MDRPDIIETAASRKREILSSHIPDTISPELDDSLRASFDIKLPRKAMAPDADL